MQRRKKTAEREFERVRFTRSAKKQKLIHITNNWSEIEGRVWDRGHFKTKSRGSVKGEGGRSGRGSLSRERGKGKRREVPKHCESKMGVFTRIVVVQP